MTHVDLSNVSGYGFKNTIAEPLLIAAGYVIFVCMVGPWWEVYQFNYDEGLNLVTAALLSEGFELYTEIWSDQPPVISMLLGAVHSVFTGSVAAARALILSFAAILLASLFILVRSFEGRLAAWVSVLVLAGSQIFMKNSVSVMVGVPAVTFSVIALALLSRDHSKLLIWTPFIAGLVFAISLQSKMFTLLILPVIVLLIFVIVMCSTEVNKLAAVIKNEASMIAGLVCGFVAIAFLTGATDFDQIFAIHGQAREADALMDKGGLMTVYQYMRSDEKPLLVMGFLGILTVTCRWRRSDAVLVGWICITIVALSIHRPLWKHHLVLLIVPLSWIAGCGVARLVEFYKTLRVSESTGTRGIATILVLLVIAISAFGIPEMRQRLSYVEPLNEASERLRWFAVRDSWVLTDAPMDAYRAGLLVPPPLALYSEKRIKTGNLSDEVIKTAFRSYRPTQVSLHRFTPNPELLNWFAQEAFLTRKYGLRSMLKPNRYYHYVTRDMYDDWAENKVDRGESRKAANALMSSLFELSYISKLTGYGGVHFHKYGHRYDGFTQGVRLNLNQVVTLPPHSAQQIGQCFLSAFHVLNLDKILKESLRVARALACSQSTSGGWAAVASLNLSCMAGSDEVPLGANQAIDSETTDNLASVLAFTKNLEKLMKNISQVPPPWLSRMNDLGISLLKSQKAKYLNQTASEFSSDSEINQVPNIKEFEFEADILKDMNPDGFQTTKNLVEQCNALINVVSRS